MSKLLVVATPIGNLSDISPRVREALEICDVIYAEDTRVTLKLLNRFDIKKPMISCHRHNEDERTPKLIARMLEEDITVALTCDAGTPGISDPGHLLVAAAWEAGIPVCPVSGPSATVTALSASGFDAREFAFYGFLPREQKPLREKLEAIRETAIPVAVLYESPHRIVKLIREIFARWGDIPLCVCCDLTKKYETIYRGACSDVLSRLEKCENVEKGEYCVVACVPAPEEKPAREAGAAEYVLSRMLGGMELDEALDEASGSYPRNELYKLRLKIRERFGD